jgi:hypothetical protein
MCEVFNYNKIDKVRDVGGNYEQPRNRTKALESV